jgi:hypothetical protein
MRKFRFIEQISKTGEDKKVKMNRVSWIPREFHNRVERFEGKQARVIIAS